MKKAVGKLTRQEKAQLKSGDKTVLYEKLGLLEEKDLKLYQTKFGIKNEQMTNEESLKNILADKSNIGKRSLKSGYQQKKELASKDHFVSMMHQFEEDKQKLSEMDEEEL